MRKRVKLGRRARLADRRNNAGLTQQQVADATGVDRLTYASYEQGNRTPTLNRALEIARVLETSVEDIFGGNDKPNQASSGVREPA